MSSVNGSKRPLGNDTKFINRRGHDAGITSDDLNGLDIEAQPTYVVETDAHENPKNNEAVPAKKLKRENSSKPPIRRRRWSRRKVLLLLGIIVGLLLIPVIVGEFLRAQYTASAKSSQTKIASIIASDVLPLQKKSDISSEQVTAVVTKLDSVKDSMCPGGILDNVASLYPRAKVSHSDCIAQRERIAALASYEREVAAQLAYIEALDSALAKVNSPRTDTYAVIANEQSSWQSVKDSVQALKPPVELADAHGQLLAAVALITDGWSKLNVASGSQNATDFQAAETQLSTGYANVRVTKDAFAQIVTDTQNKVSVQASKLSK